jgi:hypothetical protein
MIRKRFAAFATACLPATRFLFGVALVWSAMSGSALARGTPEIDPGSATSALTLLAGGILLLKPRFGRKQR